MPKHESSLSRLIKRIVLILFILGLVYFCYDTYFQVIKTPLPQEITPIQRKHTEDLSRRLSLASWTWSVEVGGRTVRLYDKGLRVWRRIK